ncbi:ATP-binding cassette subfamily C protein/ATP-binding cassette subfamily C protein CydC [Nocardia tenerifensis]|uniref:ATP-binding cassette subfamily C protein/ATP-binding cassette subfamily C protein CydC n=1 Tax=Nocardia tenerifensis TaxID=228006 RepID=A0A318JXN9_9NOCA|nr:thiol reductant ABC exporter subunit CydC [Nocardia tenerifensis]PXX58677.1 ATP-binding cassette subfamily C protein/ATP-binding cassette subfamily C protein CydC [Nocardia tenerifensis]
MTTRLLTSLLPHWRRLLPAAATAVAAELAAVALMATAAWLIARAAEQPPISAVTVAIVAVRALALGRGVLRYVDRLLGHDGALAAVTDLRATLYRALEPLAPNGISAFRSGDLLTRLVDDVDAVQDLLLRCLVPATVAAGVTIAAAGTAAVLSPTAGTVLVTGLLIAGVAVPGAVFASTGRSPAEKDVRGALAARTADLLDGAADLAAYNAIGSALAAARELDAELARRERAKAWTAGLAGSAVLLIQGGTTIAVAALAQRAGLSSITVTVLVVLALTAFEAITPLPAAAHRYAEVRMSARRLSAILNAAPAVVEPSRTVVASDHTVRIRGLRVPGRLDGPVDLLLEPGRRVALVGPSGSGKSTVLAVLMRFVEYQGSVTIGGRELRSLPGDEVRRLITGVTQDAHIFHTSIRENLAFAKPDAPHEELRAAARQARLLDWIESLPNGWDTPVGAGGAAMSGGQRQRLVLARALLADPPVLVLDEPTEGLDPDTAEELLADVLAVTRHRTTLLVTHNAMAQAAVDEIHSTAGTKSISVITPLL